MSSNQITYFVLSACGAAMAVASIKNGQYRIIGGSFDRQSNPIIFWLLIAFMGSISLLLLLAAVGLLT